jgi:hypothetical protein
VETQGLRRPAGRNGGRNDSESPTVVVSCQRSGKDKMKNLAYIRLHVSTLFLFHFLARSLPPSAMHSAKGRDLVPQAPNYSFYPRKDTEIMLQRPRPVVPSCALQAARRRTRSSPPRCASCTCTHIQPLGPPTVSQKIVISAGGRY